MEKTRKAWNSPRVFVLGAENTMAGQITGGSEGATQTGDFCFDHDNDPVTENICVKVTLTYSN